MTWNEVLERGPLLTDGAWGTQLQAMGLAIGECPDAWNLSHPGQVREVARAYVEAGSDVVLTNTFRANPISLMPHGLAGEVAALNGAGVRLSREAAEGGALVFASVGPTGKMLEMGDVTEQELRDAFRAQTEALAAAAPDVLLLETMSDLTEASIALEAARETGLPVIVSFAFDTGRNRDRTMTGVKPEQAAVAMQDAGADAVGANCGNGIDAFPTVCARMRAATTLPLWMKANAGMPEMEGGEVVYRTRPSDYAAHLPALFEAGAFFIGGCCGTSPAFIAELRKVWDTCVSA